MLNRKLKALLAIPAVIGLAALSQGSCTTTPWQAWHYPYLGEQGTAEATVYEIDVTVIPPNPPFTTEYETTWVWIALETKDMTPHTIVPYPGYNMYIGHDVEMGPDMPGRSTLLYARYTHADLIQMVSDGLNGVGTYVTEDYSGKPGTWDWCGPAFP